MCGRYQFSLEQPALRELFERARERFPQADMEVGEIFPTNTVPVLFGAAQGAVPCPAKWGYPSPKGGGVIINARSETAADKPMFRESLRAYRCAVPASGFFEWSHDKAKNKYRFRLRDDGALYFAGLYRSFAGERRFVILTEAANGSMAGIHDRMPVILREEQVAPWLADGAQAAVLLRHAPPELRREEQGDVQQSLY
ncbi:MAG: SOS response-associated peptidase [Eubacteriales bacterium]|nr:SOS response-associated peptidase [Eubacteriales bacterium]